MARALGVAHALTGVLGDLLIAGLGLRMKQTYNFNLRDNTPAGNNVVNMFIDGESSEFEYAASIVTACADQTTYAIQCTAGPDINGAEPCGSSAPIATVTSGASFYQVSVATTTEGVGIDVQETCALAGTTAATCTATAKISAGGTYTSSVTTSTMTGTDYHRFDVTITAGAKKTQNSTTKCAKNAAASTIIPKKFIWALAGVAVASIHTVL